MKYFRHAGSTLNTTATHWSASEVEKLMQLVKRHVDGNPMMGTTTIVPKLDWGSVATALHTAGQQTLFPGSLFPSRSAKAVRMKYRNLLKQAHAKRDESTSDDISHRSSQTDYIDEAAALDLQAGDRVLYQWHDEQGGVSDGHLEWYAATLKTTNKVKGSVPPNGGPKRYFIPDFDEFHFNQTISMIDAAKAKRLRMEALGDGGSGSTRQQQPVVRGRASNASVRQGASGTSRSAIAESSSRFLLQGHGNASWTDQELEQLMRLVRKHSPVCATGAAKGSSAAGGYITSTSSDWELIAEELGTGRTANAVYLKWYRASLRDTAVTSPALSTAASTTNDHHDVRPPVSQGARVRKAVDSFDPAAEAKRPQLAAKAVPSQPSRKVRRTEADADASTTAAEASTTAAEARAPAPAAMAEQHELRRWTDAELLKLRQLVAAQQKQGGSSSATFDWDSIANELGTGRTRSAVVQKYQTTKDQFLSAAEEGKGGAAAAMAAAIAKLRPHIEGKVNAHGLSWDDVLPTFELIDSVDEVLAAVDNAEAFLSRLLAAWIEPVPLFGPAADDDTVSPASDDDAADLAAVQGLASAADKPSEWIEWKDPEVDRLIQLVEKHSSLSADSSHTACNWAAVAEELGTGRSANAVSLKYRRGPKQNAPSKKTSAPGGHWTDTEVEMLQQLVEKHGADWTAIAKALGTNRTPKAVETKQYQIRLAARHSFIVEEGSLPKDSGGEKRQRKAISRFDPEEAASRPQLARKIPATGSSSISLMNQSAGAAQAYAPAATTVPQTSGAAAIGRKRQRLTAMAAASQVQRDTAVKLQLQATTPAGSLVKKQHACSDGSASDGSASDNDEDLDGVDTGFAFNRWTAPETERLMQLVKEHGVVSEGSCYSTCKWESVAAALGTNRTASGVRDKHVAILKKERDNSGPPRQQPGGGLSLDENEGKVVREERSASGRIRKVVSYDTAAVDQAITGRLCRKWTDTENKKLLQVCVTPHRAATGI